MGGNMGAMCTKKHYFGDQTGAIVANPTMWQTQVSNQPVSFPTAIDVASATQCKQTSDRLASALAPVIRHTLPFIFLVTPRHYRTVTWSIVGLPGSSLTHFLTFNGQQSLHKILWHIKCSLSVKRHCTTKSVVKRSYQARPLWKCCSSLLVPYSLIM